jgi:hypothetical protein
LHLDATLIRADIDKERVGKLGSSDPDARHGWKKGTPGYKQQTVADGKARVVVDVSVTPADRHEHDGAVAAVDRAITHIGQTPEAVCADAAYASGPNKAALEERGVRLVSPPREAGTYTHGTCFSVADFSYDGVRDVFLCPAGQTLRFVGVPKDRPDRRKYRARRAACSVCPLKDRCTVASVRELKVGVHHAALVRLREDSHTESFRRLYRTRAPVIEGIFAEAKQWHGLRRAWRRGLSNMLIQSLLVAAVLNFKRLLAASASPGHFCRAMNVFVIDVRRMMRTIQDITQPWTARNMHPAPIL